ncbi:MAG: glutathione S-transferase family protein [Alphaproteobacteria bacterium]|nr:glutathione S-transferase family protein [Alphaproteobacteria bacterium]
MLTLYYAPKTCSLAPFIALEETGAPFEPYRVNFAEGEQNSATYKALNPKGRVPALATPQGVLSENVAILAFIAQTYPSAKLAPSDPFAFAQMQAFNAYLSSTVHVNHAHNRRGHRWSDDPAVVEALKTKVPQNMADCFAIIEKEYLKGPWVMGEQYTVADAYLFTISNWLEGDGVDITNFPKVLAHRQAIQARPAVARAMEQHGG